MIVFNRVIKADLLDSRERLMEQRPEGEGANHGEIGEERAVCLAKKITMKKVLS